MGNNMGKGGRNFEQIQDLEFVEVPTVISTAKVGERLPVGKAVPAAKAPAAPHPITLIVEKIYNRLPSINLLEVGWTVLLIIGCFIKSIFAIIILFLAGLYFLLESLAGWLWGLAMDRIRKRFALPVVENIADNNPPTPKTTDTTNSDGKIIINHNYFFNQ